MKDLIAAGRQMLEMLMETAAEPFDIVQNSTDTIDCPNCESGPFGGFRKYKSPGGAYDKPFPDGGTCPVCGNTGYLPASGSAVLHTSGVIVQGVPLAWGRVDQQELDSVMRGNDYFYVLLPSGTADYVRSADHAWGHGHKMRRVYGPETMIIFPETVETIWRIEK